MDQIYLKEHLQEELDGAEEYIRRAIEIKAMDQSWAKWLYEMSVDELKHAGYVYKMAQDYYMKVSSAYKEAPGYMSDCMSEITNMYTSCYSDIKYLQDLFNR